MKTSLYALIIIISGSLNSLYATAPDGVSKVNFKANCFFGTTGIKSHLNSNLNSTASSRDVTADYQEIELQAATLDVSYNSDNYEDPIHEGELDMIDIVPESQITLYQDEYIFKIDLKILKILKKFLKSNFLKIAIIFHNNRIRSNNCIFGPYDSNYSNKEIIRDEGYSRLIPDFNVLKNNFVDTCYKTKLAKPLNSKLGVSYEKYYNNLIINSK